MNTSNHKSWDLDTIDKMIVEEGLSISSLYFNKELDIMLVLLNNKKVLKYNLSSFNKLTQASLSELNEYTISKTGVHWPALDEDLSLRGFLKEEIRKALHQESLVA